MKLVEFRIQIYKSIIDAGWVKVNDLIVLVGKNEVGKTSLLRGQHKFNPFHADPHDLAREWPRGKRDQKSEQQIVCRTRFPSLKDQRALVAYVDSTCNRFADLTRAAESTIARLE